MDEHYGWIPSNKRWCLMYESMTHFLSQPYYVFISFLLHLLCWFFFVSWSKFGIRPTFVIILVIMSCTMSFNIEGHNDIFFPNVQFAHKVCRLVVRNTSICTCHNNTFWVLQLGWKHTTVGGGAFSQHVCKVYFYKMYYI
jgi:hypothetical protein